MARRKRNSRSFKERDERREPMMSRGSRPSAGPGPMSVDTLEGVYSPSALSGSPVVGRNWERSALTAASRTNTWGLNAATFMFPNFYGGNRGGVETTTSSDVGAVNYINTGARVVSALSHAPIITDSVDSLLTREVYDAIRSKTRTYRTYTFNDIRQYLRLAFWAYSMDLSLRYLYYLSAVKFPDLLDLGGRFAEALARDYALYGWEDRSSIESKMKSSQTFLSTFFLPPKLMAYAHWLAASYWLYDNELGPVGMYMTYGTVQSPQFTLGLTGSTLGSAASPFTYGASILDVAESVEPADEFPGPDTVAGNTYIKRLLVTDLYHVYGESSRMNVPDWEECSPRIDTKWTSLWRNSQSVATFSDGEVEGRVSVPPLAGVADQFGGSTTVTDTPDNAGTIPWFSAEPPTSLELVSWGLSYPILQTVDSGTGESAAYYYLPSAIDRVINYSMCPWVSEAFIHSTGDSVRNGEWRIDVTPPSLHALIDANATGDLNTVGVRMAALGNGAIFDYEGDDSSTNESKAPLLAGQAYYASLLMSSERIWTTTWGTADLPTDAVVTGGAKVWQQGLAPLYQPRRAGHPYLVSANVIRNALFEFGANLARM